MELTASNIKARLQIAQCRFVVQGLDVIYQQRRGKKSCAGKLSDIMQGFNLIDSIVGYDPAFAHNCLTTIQVEHILNKLCDLAPAPCGSVPTVSVDGGIVPDPNATIQYLQNQIDALRNEIDGGIEIDR